MCKLVSIITVCYNSSKTIESTFLSILSQSFKDFEYIVIDGGSIDGTVDIIKSYESKFHNAGIEFIWSSEPDSGIYDAMNKGISKCNGELIGILNSDDVYFPLTIQKVKTAFENNKDFNVYHGLLKHVSNGKVTQITGTSSDRLIKSMIEHPACFVTKRTYDNFGLFNCTYKYVADYDFMLRVKFNSGKFFMMDDILAQFDENGTGNSSRSRKELILLRKKYNLISTSRFLFLNIRLLLAMFKKRCESLQLS